MRITGRITDEQRRFLADLEVVAYDRDLRSQQELGKARTSHDGRYTIEYSPAQFERAEKRSADVFVEVRRPGGGELRRSAVSYNAEESTTIDLVVDDDFLGGAELTRLRAEVTALAADAHVAVADLDDTEEHADVAFLSAELGVPAERVVHFILAHRLERDTALDAAFFYAVLRTDVLATFSIERLHALRSVTSLGVDRGAVVDELALVPAATLTRAVDTAIERRIVEASLRERLPEILTRLKARESDARKADAERARGALVDLIGRPLAGEALKALGGAVAHDHLGNLPLLIERVRGAVARRSDTASAEVRATLERARLRAVDGSLMAGVKKHLKIDTEAGVRKLAALDRAGWIETLRAAKAAGAFGEAAPAAEATAREAARLADDFARRYPSAAFTLRLARATDAVLPEAAALARIVQDRPELDLATASVDRLFRDGGIAPGATPVEKQAWKAALKAAQRLYRLSPSEAHARALAREQLGSARAVSALGRNELVARLSRHPGVTAEEAAHIHDRASRIHAGAVLLAGELKSLGGSLEAAVMTPAVAADKRAAWLADFPNLSSLFEVGDLCECVHCRSVLGPAAYLADVLQFLGERTVLDTTVTGSPISRGARAALLARRPDLGDLDLDCSNAFTELPYIDLVNELLEELVAPDPGFLYGGSIPLGPAPPALVQAVTDRGLPLGSRPVITEIEPAQAFVLRGTEAAYRLDVATGGGFTVKRTRQTRGTAAERAAAPEYVSRAAYDKLAASRIAFALPFDAPHRETEALFARFDVRRADLMRALATAGAPSELGIAAAELGMSKRVADLIATAEPTKQDELWNTPAGTAVATLAHVAAFLDRTGVSYRELEDATAPDPANGGLLRQAFIDPDGKLFIERPDAGCDTSKQRIAGLDDAALDRIHRFLRLWRATGLSQAQLDLAIRHAAGKLDGVLVRLGHVARLARRTGQAAGELLLLYGPGWPRAAYDRIFANSANGAAELAAPLVAANEGKPAGSRVQLADRIAPIALALGRTPAEIVALLAIPGTGGDLTFAGLARLHGLSEVARIARLSSASLAELRRLSGIDPVAGPAETWSFLELSRLISDAGIDPVALGRLLAVSATAPDPRIPGDAAVQALLARLQAELASALASSRPELDATLDPPQNTQPLLDLLARLGDLDATVLARIESLTRGRWSDPSETPVAFLDRVLVPVLAPAAKNAVDGAWAKLAAAIAAKDPALAERNAFISALATGVGETLYQRLRSAAAVRAISGGLQLDEALATSLLRGAHLKAVPAAEKDTLEEVLTDAALATPASGHLPAITPAAFPQAFAAVKQCAVIGIGAALLRLAPRHVAWLLRQPAAAGFLELDRLPYAASVPEQPLAPVVRWLRARRIEEAYPPIDDPLAPGATLAVLDVIELASSTGALEATVRARLAAVTGWEPGVLDALGAHLGVAGAARYADPSLLSAIEDAIAILARLGVPVASGVRLAGDVVSADDAAVARAALRVRYAPSDWLAVGKSIEDGLREQRRDALVSYLVATDARFRSASDLFEELLVNVDMSACQPTSRIVQAHGTVQLFVERCRLGLEPATVADTTHDTGWQRWSWMSSYRVWEANRRVFLYPENWIEPELRDDKSPFFVELERALAQAELTDRAAEDATAGYLERLDEVAYLEHRASHFDPIARVSHVFARTKGGDPTTYYYRRFLQEREWTPWEKVDLDITADHLLAFVRNGRLYLAWPLFEEEPEPTAGGKTTPKPGDPSDTSSRKRLKVKLAVSEYSNGRWLPKKLSKDGLVNEGYSSDPPKPDSYRLVAADLGSAGFNIVVTVSLRDKIDRYYGAFSLTGCKGYPEPASLDLRPFLEISPRFKDTRLQANRPSENGLDADNDFSLSELPVPRYEQQLFKNTPDGNAGVPGAPVSTSSATFRVAYPWQMTSLDQTLTLFELLSPTVAPTATAPPMKVALGTLLPFFFEDHNRVYSLVPGWFAPESVPGAGPVVHTASDLIPRFDFLVAKVVYAYQQTIAKDGDGDDLMAFLAADEEFKAAALAFAEIISQQDHFGYRVANAFHPLVCAFRSALAANGLPGLLTRELQLKTTGFDFTAPEAYAPTALVVAPRPIEDVDFRRDGAYAGYNWELFFHLPFEIAVRLSKDRRFEEAMRWFHFIFDPTGSRGGTAPQRYWITAPFFQRMAGDYAEQRIDDILYRIATDPAGGSLGTLADAIEDWRDRPFQPHVVARSRSVAYQKTVVLRYIQNLIDWGDSLFRQETMESINRADQLYALAEKLLGPRPRLVPPAAEPRPSSFNELARQLDRFSNALVELENLVSVPPTSPDATEPPPPPSSLTGLYFCVPPNDKMFEYWDVVADRRFKIAHCRTIDGAERTLALFAPRIDPAELVRAAAQGLPIGAVLAGLGGPVSPYRFPIMVQRAVELVQELRTLGQELAQALEKRDGEALAVLRGTLELALYKKITAMKEAQILEAVEQTKAIERSIAIATERRTYYRSRVPISPLEVLALALQGVSAGLQDTSASYLSAAAIINLLPNVTLGFAGIGGSPTATVTWGSSNVASGLSSFASEAGANAGRLGTVAAQTGALAGYERRREEWEFQGNLADKEIAQLNQQLAVAGIREDVTRKDLASHRQQIDNAQRTDAFMRSKFTNRELYDWFAAEISAIYFQAYDLAFTTAKKAERCFQYELGATDTFVRYGSWDSLRRGLGAANALMQQVRRMEAAYYDRNRRDYELVKHVSLAELDPMALLQLKNEGKCTVTVPEAVFDLDHAGHYMRRLKAVAMSVPCVAGPYTSVACRLTLLSNRYRRSAVAANAAAYPEDPGQDDRFAYNLGGIQSIATSQGQNDSGMFELNFRDDRYLPFEGCGAIGTWQIALGSQVRSFDLATISDVVLHLRYTAREGGSGLRGAAEGALLERLNKIENAAKKAGLSRLIDLRHEAPDVWSRLQHDKAASFTITGDMLPQLASGHAPAVSDAWLLARVAPGKPADFPVQLDGVALTATKDTLVKGLSSVALVTPPPPPPAPPPPSTPLIVLDKQFQLAAANAADLQDVYVLIRYQLS